MKTNKILSHFKKVDPVLYSIAKEVGPVEDFTVRESSDYFRSLCREIVGQQLSGKVANVIFDRFVKLFPKQEVTPENILKIPDEDIRNVGMSWSKVKFVKDLAQKVIDGTLDVANLNKLNDQQVMEQLMQVKGIGPWTAEMFLMFTLGREDIFSAGDLGLKNAIIKLYNLEKPSQEEILAISKEWSPYRTYASRVLWKT
ncbi:MAG: DNA-3-methyladenine glycosylase 2 family protein, partial [Deltaproteobacteria bacterium]|nr:DNA-3-methyladenine glycosylase 2 family protein [Deltaproteobacteria bacterium]